MGKCKIIVKPFRMINRELDHKIQLAVHNSMHIARCT